jgi:hypothetical protein
MKFYYASEKRQLSLVYQATSWIGTRWCSNSAQKGVGVSCHNLPRELYIASGALISNFPQLVGTPNQAKHNKDYSDMEVFLDDRSEFLRLKVGEKPMPGDLLGLRIKHGVDHLGVVLSDYTFIHVLMHKHTCLDNHRITPWLERTLAIWRPIE